MMPVSPAQTLPAAINANPARLSAIFICPPAVVFEWINAFEALLERYIAVAVPQHIEFLNQQVGKSSPMGWGTRLLWLPNSFSAYAVRPLGNAAIINVVAAQHFLESQCVRFVALFLVFSLCPLRRRS